MNRLAVITGLAVLCALHVAEAQQRQRAPLDRVYKARITPHWFENNTRFWYRNDLPRDAQEFILVNADRGTRSLAFDHAKLAAGLSKAVGDTNFSAAKLPFTLIQFDADANAVLF